MALVFLGSPPEAQGALRALHDAGHEIALVVTQPDRKRGRGGDLVPSPVKRTATELGLTVVTPERCKEALDDIAGSGAELGVVVAFGQLIPPSVLAALPAGYVNVHFSLLPPWRGGAPVGGAAHRGGGGGRGGRGPPPKPPRGRGRGSPRRGPRRARPPRGAGPGRHRRRRPRPR